MGDNQMLQGAILIERRLFREAMAPSYRQHKILFEHESRLKADRYRIARHDGDVHCARFEIGERRAPDAFRLDFALCWQKLPDADKANLTAAKAIALMQANPSMIKRPVLETGKAIEIGFKPERYAALLGG